MSTKILVSLVLFASIAAQSAVNYPYPQRKNYGNGTINATNSTASANLKLHFKDFVDKFYVKGSCNGTPCARIKFDPEEEQYTVSEGIGYAMIMMVYFSETNESYQTHFDSLWAYYQRWKNGNGVMHWKINGFSSIAGENGATDAELDVAVALAMARYQFGDTKYETAATNLIKDIWKHEVEINRLLKPGDAWNSSRNPSYVSPAAFEIFKGLSTEGWDTVLTKNYTFLKANQNATQSSNTKLPSGWADDNGTPKVCSNNCGINVVSYDQDAVRAPWRWAWANAWYGHADAKTLINNLAPWVNGKNPGDISGPISLSGTMGANPNSAYVGSLACALTNASKYQDKLNTYWSYLNGIENEPYFNRAIRILTGLLITGNMPNLKACASNTGCGTDMGTGGGGGGTYTSIDKLADAEGESEEERGFAATWEPWYAYTDVGSDGASKMENTKFKSKDENDGCKEIDSYRVVMKDDNDWVAKIDRYTLTKGSNKYAPFVALGLDAKNNGAGKSYNFAQCTNGFRYSYKGQGHNFKVQTTAVTQEGADHFTSEKVASTGWTIKEVSFSQLSQPSWTDTDKKVAFDPSKIKAFAWELKGEDDGTAGVSALTGSLAIKDFHCMGNMILPSSRPPSVCGGGGSSSSRGSSSSVSGSGGSSSSRGSSSSVSGSGGSSSSRGSSSSVSGSGTSSSSRSSTSTGGASSSSVGTSGSGESSSSGGGTNPITISKIAKGPVRIHAISNAIVLENLPGNAKIEVYNLRGKLVYSQFSTLNSQFIPIQTKGLYIAKVNKEVLYVPVK
jgi:endo-1,4-beta-D-glucanase Y